MLLAGVGCTIDLPTMKAQQYDRPVNGGDWFSSRWYSELWFLLKLLHIILGILR